MTMFLWVRGGKSKSLTHCAASEAIDWIILNTETKNRESALEVCRKLYSNGCFSIVVSSKPVNNFNDDESIFLKFEVETKVKQETVVVMFTRSLRFYRFMILSALQMCWP